VINNDGIPFATTVQLWTSGTETLSLGCGNSGGGQFTQLVVTATEPASVNGFVVRADLNGLNPSAETFGAPVGSGSPAFLVLSNVTTNVRAEGQLEIARFGAGAAVWTFSFHEHADSVGNCHIQATIFPATS
jgi:hypothetical protein